MKIPFTNDTLNAIISLIDLSAQKIITEKVAELEDVEQIAALRAAQMDDYSRVVHYLNHTKLHHPKKVPDVLIANSDLAHLFGLNLLAMKRIRTRLIAEGRAVEKNHHGVLHVVYTAPAPPAAGATAQATPAP